MPIKGDIAICAHGYLGLITCEQPEYEPSTAGNIGAEIWTGIQLTNKNGRTVGGPWQSRRPTIVSHSNMLASIFEKAARWDELQFDLAEQKAKEERRREPGPAYVKKGGPFPSQPYESQRYAADGFFDGDNDYNGD